MPNKTNSFKGAARSSLACASRASFSGTDAKTVPYCQISRKLFDASNLRNERLFSCVATKKISFYEQLFDDRMAVAIALQDKLVLGISVLKLGGAERISWTTPVTKEAENGAIICSDHPSFL